MQRAIELFTLEPQSLFEKVAAYFQGLLIDRIGLGAFSVDWNVFFLKAGNILIPVTIIRNRQCNLAHEELKLECWI